MICCSICQENVDFILSCSHCAESACKVCYEKYFIAYEKCCMYCKHKSFSEELIRDKFGKNFVDTKLKKVLKQRLVNNFLSYQPELQTHAASLKLCQELRLKTNDILIEDKNANDHYYKSLYAKQQHCNNMRTLKFKCDKTRNLNFQCPCLRYVLKDSLCSGCNKRHCPVCLLEISTTIANHKCPEFARLKEMKSDYSTIINNFNLAKCELRSVRSKKNFHYREIARLQRLSNLRHSNSQEEKTRTFKVQYNCPKEDCKGLIVNNTCGICDGKYCAHCRLEKDETTEHVCDKETVETVNLLKADCKGCPKCGIQIYKISGCNQMFCTTCHTTFDWKTLKIEVGFQHNPHYLAWRDANRTDADKLRNQQQQQQQVLNCNQELMMTPFTDDILNQHFTRVNNYYNIDLNQALQHYHHNSLLLNVELQNYEICQKQTIVKFLANVIDHKKMEMYLHKHYKRMTFVQHYLEYRRAFGPIIIELWNNLNIDNVHQTALQLNRFHQFYMDRREQLYSMYDYLFHRNADDSFFVGETMIQSLYHYHP